MASLCALYCSGVKPLITSAENVGCALGSGTAWPLTLGCGAGGVSIAVSALVAAPELSSSEIGASWAGGGGVGDGDGDGVGDPVGQACFISPSGASLWPVNHSLNAGRPSSGVLE